MEEREVSSALTKESWAPFLDMLRNRNQTPDNSRERRKASGSGGGSKTDTVGIKVCPHYEPG